MGHSAEGGKENAGPEDHLAQVVGAADDAVKAGVHEALGVDFLGLILLDVRGRFQNDTENHDGGINPAHQTYYY